jgi:hypothetical protein
MATVETIGHNCKLPIEQSPEVTISPVECIRHQFLTLSAPSVFLDNPCTQVPWRSSKLYPEQWWVGSLQAAKSSLTVRWLSFNRGIWRIEPEDLRPLL